MQGAIFGDKRSKEDYNAIMNYARVTPPAIKENYVDIAGGNSSIDLTEAVGGVAFEDGKIDFKFTLFDTESKERMKNDLHGKRVDIILEREPEFYHTGRISVASEKQAGSIWELCMNARVSPYKVEKHLTVHAEEVQTAKEIIICNERMPAMPKITVKGNIRISYEGIGFALETGIYEIPEITFRGGINRLKVSGNGNIRIEYRKGRLI
ncbi:MAG: hypothetical protein HDQ96_04805 [Lachnospiraceae bacterium]|nr:hypothetical protein [Lachnospiraceae bacterium]